MLRVCLHRPLLAVLVVGLMASSGRTEESLDLQEKTYQTLDQIRENKLSQLTSYLERISLLAEKARDDPAMLSYFKIKQRYWQLQQEAPAPPEVQETIGTLKDSMRDHCLSNYQAFYDVLFVDRSGFVLSSVRQQKDYHQNLLEGQLATTALSKRLLGDPRKAFVDYEFYWASDEPSAFFVEPLIEGGQHLGWFVLQCAFNKVNTIFTRGEALGQTGETFLVNRQHQMLTDSRLRPGDGNRPRSLAQENITSKFTERQGHKRVTDYRGYAALTSFAVCPVLGSEWLLIAKIDEDEVITRYFGDHHETLQPMLFQKIALQPQPTCPAQTLPRDVTMVDMDEYRFSNKEPLITFGVCTCTAIVITLPRQAAIMGHASIEDRIYGPGDVDVVGNMVRHIRQFEIYPFELRDLQVTVIAPHFNSLAGTLEQLMNGGFLLSQIRFLHDPSAESATVVHDPATGKTLVQWVMDNQEASRWQRAEDAPSLDIAVKALIGYK